MATAYAAVTSLMHLITQLREHPYPPIQLEVEAKQFDSLRSNIRFFQRFLEDHHSTIDHGLEIRIADAAEAAEDVIETRIADRAHGFYGTSLQKAIEGMDLIRQEVMGMNLNEPSRRDNSHPVRRQSPLTTSPGENFVVGIEDTTIKIMHQLTSSQHKSDRQIISISGMGGIGKTTLAHKVYNHPYIKDKFDVRAWASVSKDYNTKDIVVDILRSLDSNNNKDSLSQKNEHDLSQGLYQYLFGRRYLVILDDVWDLEAWEKLRSFFPTRGGSGIVITTRELPVASIGSHSFRVDLLDEHNSWDLFRKRAFGQDSSCPSELVNVGKQIAIKCRGLPLSIVVIASHLEKSPRTVEYWENIAQNISSVVNSEGNDRCLKIISLSYTHLPLHLKPCFLYTTIFPEDEDIKVSRLTNLWVAEGFVKPVNGETLEDTARYYLYDLIGRNLILAYKSCLSGRIKSCQIHDLLRDFSLKEARKKNFLCIVQKLDDFKAINNKRRIVVHSNALHELLTTDLDLLSKKHKLSEIIGTEDKETIGLNEPIVNHRLDISIVLKARVLVRTLIVSGILPSLENKLLRVLAPFDIYLSISRNMLQELLHRLVHTRYFDFMITDLGQFYDLPPSIFLHWNLQFLMIGSAGTYIKAPLELWKMPQLRHIKVRYLSLPHPPSESNEIILENLQSAQQMMNFSFCEEVVKRIPNIKKLEVVYNEDYDGFEEGLCTLNNVDRLQKLESFECYLHMTNVEQSYHMLRNLTFPHSLKKLHFAELYWDDVATKIGLLPLLEVLELYRCMGHEWKLVEGQFVKLRFLGLYYCDSLRYFAANNNHLPCLQCLLLCKLESLEGISSEIGDIDSLKSIELEWCPDSAVTSAKEIAVEQYDLGNEELQVSAVVVSGSNISESLSACNFEIKRY